MICIHCGESEDVRNVTVYENKYENEGFLTYGVHFEKTERCICQRCLDKHYRKTRLKYYVSIYDAGFCVDGKYYTHQYIERESKLGNIYYCVRCGIWHKISNRPVFTIKDGDSVYSMCENGYRHMVSICECCGEPTLRMNSYDYNGKTYCRQCYQDRTKYKIKSYHEHIDLKWYDDNNEPTDRQRGTPYFGFELEVGAGGESDSASEEVIKMFDEEVYTMHDGSIEDGFEIISHPHTEKALFNMPYDDVFKRLADMGYLSHNISCCGLHLHIGREMFKTRNALAKMLYFYENNKDDLLRFSRRRLGQLNRWSAFYSPFDEGLSMDDCYTIIDSYDQRGDHDDRYKAVNLQRTSTVEIRCMRGTLLPSTFRATLDFIITIAKNSNTISELDIDDTSKWLEGVKEETINYMKQRDCFGYTNITEEV